MIVIRPFGQHLAGPSPMRLRSRYSPGHKPDANKYEPWMGSGVPGGKRRHLAGAA
ncbi:MAG TPA: hypothetical protein VGD87_00100 [Archangium sp.]